MKVLVIKKVCILIFWLVLRECHRNLLFAFHYFRIINSIVLFFLFNFLPIVPIIF